MELVMYGKQLCLCLMLFVLLMHGSLGQDEEKEMDTTEVAVDVEMTTAHVMPSTSEALQQEAAETEAAAEPDPAAEPAPEPEPEPAPDSEPNADVDPVAEPAAESAAEPAAESAAEPAAESAAEPAAESAAESAVEPAAEPAAESAAEPVPAGEPEPAPGNEHEPPPAAEPAVKDMEAIPTMSADLDYQNDAVVTENLSGKSTQKPSSEATIPTKQNPVVESNSGLNCYSCSSYKKGKCDDKPTDKLPCPTSSKNGCYTLFKRDSKLIMRGCVSELSEEGDKYCRKEPKLCKMCYDRLCNKELAPQPGSGSARFMLTGNLIWISCMIALF
ncbi:proteoglycan 4 [Drosophila innubila]|uniref:proteoglycan 4 n=1 Tax=Drosophila innubila TaxID=198719 RepID=UPI00148DAE5A|nr:proteoglycan 4 [Drosophila innubila]